MRIHEIIFEDEKMSSAQAAYWRKQNPIGQNFMKPEDYDSDAPGTHIIMDHPTSIHFYKVPAENYDKAFDLWLDSKGTDPKDSEYYAGSKDYASEHQYWGRIAESMTDADIQKKSPQSAGSRGLKHVRKKIFKEGNTNN